MSKCQVSEEKENLAEQNSSQTRHWGELLSHSAQLGAERRPELEEEYKQLGSALADHQMPDWETFLSVCGKILTNCFCLRSDRWEPFSVANICQCWIFLGKSQLILSTTFSLILRTYNAKAGT